MKVKLSFFFVIYYNVDIGCDNMSSGSTINFGGNNSAYSNYASSVSSASNPYNSQNSGPSVVTYSSSSSVASSYGSGSSSATQYQPPSFSEQIITETYTYNATSGANVLNNNTSSASPKTSSAIHTDPIDHHKLDAILAQGKGDIDPSQINFSRIARSASDAASGNFIPKEFILKQYWGDNGKLTFEVLPDGTILIKEDGIPMGCTDKEGVKALANQNLNKGNNTPNSSSSSSTIKTTVTASASTISNSPSSSGSTSGTTSSSGTVKTNTTASASTISNSPSSSGSTLGTTSSSGTVKTNVSSSTVSKQTAEIKNPNNNKQKNQPAPRKIDDAYINELRSGNLDELTKKLSDEEKFEIAYYAMNNCLRAKATRIEISREMLQSQIDSGRITIDQMFKASLNDRNYIRYTESWDQFGGLHTEQKW